MYLYVVFWDFTKEFYYLLYPNFIRPKSFNNLFSLVYKIKRHKSRYYTRAQDTRRMTRDNKL